jgi:BppU N-terminal domain
MTTPVLVQGDTRPTVVAILHDADDASVPLNLSTCSVVFQMRKADDKVYTVNAAATILDGPAGKVSYQFGANDLNTPGDYVLQWEVTYADLGVQTTQTPLKITVRRQ